MATREAVASGHYPASLAAQRILDRGGNAIDAGVTAGLCTCVLQTDMVDLAGLDLESRWGLHGHDRPAERRPSSRR